MCIRDRGGNITGDTLSINYIRHSTYHRPIALDNPSGAISDYTIRVLLTSSNFDFSHTLSEGEDIRFYSEEISYPYEEEDELPYYIHHWETDSAVVYVVVPHIPSGESTIHLYYGNPFASSHSSVVDTSNLTIDTLFWKCPDDNEEADCCCYMRNHTYLFDDGNLHYVGHVDATYRTGWSTGCRSTVYWQIDNGSGWNSIHSAAGYGHETRTTSFDIDQQTYGIRVHESGGCYLDYSDLTLERRSSVAVDVSVGEEDRSGWYIF